MSDKNNMLSGLFKNPVIKAALLKQLKNLMAKNNITNVVIYFTETGELDFIPYFEDMKIMPKKDFEQLLTDLMIKSEK